MRTDEQIEKIKKYESSPIQLLNVISKEKVKSLINFHNQNNKVEKNTGPVVSYVKEGAGIIDDILELLRHHYGNFKVRSAHFFDVKNPHIIHNDDDVGYPNSYKAFTIPLEVRGDTNKAKLVFFDQYYYDGPSKFINKTDITKSPKYTDHVTTYNQLITSYERVFNKSDVEMNPEHRKLLSHLKDDWLEGLTVQRYFPWTVTSIIAFDSLQLHCASNFLDTGSTSKLGLSIFTILD